MSSDEFLSDLSPKDKSWDESKARSRKVSRVLQDTEGTQKLGDRMFTCCDRLLFHRLEDMTTGKDKYKLAFIVSCHVRVCSNCQRRRQLAWLRRFHEGLPRLIAEHPSVRFVMLGLTIRNCPVDELRATVQHMNKAWNRMVQRKEWPAIGFVRSIEVTRNNDPNDNWYGTAHPHIHAILVVEPSYFGRNYLNHEQWVELWQSCLAISYRPNVDIRVVKPKSGQKIVDKDTLMSAVVETLKYSVKPDSLIADPDFLTKLVRQLHKTRAVSVGGVLKAYLSDSEISQEEMILGEGDDFGGDVLSQVTFGWRQAYQRYIKEAEY